MSVAAVLQLRFLIIDADTKTPSALTEVQNKVINDYVAKHQPFFEALTKNITQQANNVINLTKDKQDNGTSIGLNKQPSIEPHGLAGKENKTSTDRP